MESNTSNPFEAGDRVIANGVIYTVERVYDEMVVLPDGQAHSRNVEFADEYDGEIRFTANRDAKKWVKSDTEPCEVCGSTFRHIHTHEFATSYISVCPVCETEHERHE